MGRPVRRVLSGGVSPVDGHLSRRHVAVPLQRSTRGLGGPRQHPLSDLAPGEVYLASRVTDDPGGLLHHPFTLTAAPTPDRAAVCSLWHCLADHSGWVLPTALPCGARTFLGAGRTPRRDRPADPFAAPSLAAATCAPARRQSFSAVSAMRTSSGKSIGKSPNSRRAAAAAASDHRLRGRSPRAPRERAR